MLLTSSSYAVIHPHHAITAPLVPRRPTLLQIDFVPPLNCDKPVPIPSCPPDPYLTLPLATHHIIPHSNPNASPYTAPPPTLFRPTPTHQIAGITITRTRNRERCVTEARLHSGADYVLRADADWQLVVTDKDFKKKLREKPTAYDVQMSGGLDYWLSLLLHNTIHVQYKGVTHEYSTWKDKVKRMRMRGITYKHFTDGSNRSDKFQRDIRLLLADWKRDPTNPRTAFYLGQSYKVRG